MTYDEQLQLEAIMAQTMTDGAQMVINADLDKKQRAWASDEAEKAWQRSVDMYNLQNAYNSPDSQMNRLREAGLNPHLMYGQGTVGNTATSTPQYHPAQATWRERTINNPLPMALAATSQRLQQDNFRVQNQLMKEEVDIKRMEAISKALQMVVDFGDPVTDDLPEKYYDEQYKKWVDLQNIDEQSVPGLKSYQLDASRYDNQIRKQKLANMVVEGRLKSSLANIADQKLQGILKNGYDSVSKDTFTDQQLRELFGEEGNAALWKNIMPIALKLLGK